MKYIKIADRFDKTIDQRSESPRWLITSEAERMGIACDVERAFKEYMNSLNFMLTTTLLHVGEDGTLEAYELSVHGEEKPTWPRLSLLKFDAEANRARIVLKYATDWL